MGNKIKPLSKFEENCIWMSYRYCIGRHTIVSNAHAGDIAKYVYGRISDTRMQFISGDINMHIENSLHFNNISIIFDADMPVYPLYAFFEFINSEHIKTYTELNKYSKLNFTYDYLNNKVVVEKTYAGENKTVGYISPMDYEDLAVWQKLAVLFDISKHKYCLVKDPADSSERLFEYIEFYERNTDKDGYIIYKKLKTDIESYINNPNIITYINPEYIIKDNLSKNYEEQKD